MSLRTNFKIRKEPNAFGLSPVYLHITGCNSPRVRIHLNIYVDAKLWNEKFQRLNHSKSEFCDTNLILDNIDSKLTNVKTVYRLSNLPITPKILEREYLDKLSRVNFVAFFKQALEEEKSKFTDGSYNRHHSVMLKIEEYQNYIPFNQLDLSWLNNYRNHLKNKKGNMDTTINSNFASIKKFLGLAQKNGIKLLFDLDDIKVGNMNGNRTYLDAFEMKKCFDFYKSTFINPSYKLILGYFLFSCMTGLRVSNIQKLNRNQLMQNDFSLITVKNNKDKNLALNDNAKKIIHECPNLFVTKFADQHLNDELKKIMSVIGITKKVTMHVGRHTFATLFLKMGGKVEMLQMLLSHASITQTMVYVHIVQAEANKEIFLLDKLPWD
ncbi:tyrosine-type recombinase/integrase [Flavobacterium sp.]|uniref:tyrosine-type recombinase/integrase n=1 Tax=Flavobacterium sp. TaxID=239 RepID=UPI003752457A